jgi:excisionase family DNA binding protein
MEALLISAKDAAKVLCMGDRKLWELTQAKEIACVRNGRRVLYDIADLKDWIERNKVRKTTKVA